MFKNITILSTIKGANDASAIEDALHQHGFVHCGPTQERSVGWIPPRGHAHGALLESVDGQWILKLMTEVRAVPGQTMRDAVDAACKIIEDQTGRKPGKKERREIADEVKLQLLPRAFPKASTTLVWINPVANTIVIDASSQSKVDDVTGLLIRSIDGLEMQYVSTNTSPASAMAYWLSSKEAPEHFTIDRECELKACDESKAVVKYGRHPLDIDEVGQHIAQGKVPTKLALTFDDRVSFVMTDGMVLKKLALLESVFESEREESEDAFDADIAIATGELRILIPSLITALGGVMKVEPREPGSHTGTQGEPDPLYDEALKLVIAQGKPSISLVQRHLKIGYNRAARLLEDMEKTGAVSPMDKSGQRKILN